MTLARRLAPALAVTTIPVGRDDDGLVARPTSGTAFDRPWAELAAEFDDAREAWRKNPLARRLIGLTTAYVVGNGITLSSEYKPLQRFIAAFWAHNRLSLRIDEWSDELARSGELFPVLFTNPVSGLSTVRTVPAALIEAVDVDPDDYEREVRYRERTGVGLDDKWWQGRETAEPDEPVMLHYAVNRPIGAVRGESDLASVLPWLRRYSRWLEDRVRLNAAMRAFLWVVKAPARLRAALTEQYRQPPEPGTVILADPDESWEAVTPNLGASDAEKDGRAIRWMIVAGGPGTALLDVGEGEDSNLATGQAMAEQRRRFLRRRQAYLGWLLADLTVTAWSRYAAVHSRRALRRDVTVADVTVQAPDISPEDNQALASAAQALTASLTQLATITGESEAFTRLALRLYVKFTGETITADEFDAIVAEGQKAHAKSQRRQEEQEEAEETGKADELRAAAGKRAAHSVNGRMEGRTGWRE